MTSTLEELRDDVEEALGPELGSTLSRMYSGMRQREQAEADEATRVLAAAREEDPNMDQAQKVVTRSADALAQILDKEHKGWETRTGLEKVRAGSCLSERAHDATNISRILCHLVIHIAATGSLPICG